MPCYFVAIIQVGNMVKSISKQSAIELNHVSFKYEQSENLLDNINIHIQLGETVGIVGANGAGKSTILKLITGLLTPVSGQVRVLGQELSRKSIKDIRRKIGYTFQDPDNQLFMPSVFEDVAFAARQEHKSEEEIKQIVHDALTQVGGMHLMHKASYKMSGGEKRIVTLATALATKPDILILDEPSVGLDPKSRRDLIRLLQARQETMLITTHDMDMALDLCDRIIVLYNGAIQADDKPMTIFNNKKLICNNHLELPLRLQACPNCGNV